MSSIPLIRPRQVLGRITRGHRRAVVVAALLTATHQTSEALVPVVIGLVIDAAISTGDGGSLLRWIIGLMALFAVLSTAGLVGWMSNQRAALYGAHDVRMGVVTRILDPRGGADAGQAPGALVSVSTSDSDRTGTVVTSISTFAGALAAMIAGAILLFLVAVPLGLIVVVGLPILIALVHVISIPLQRRTEEDQERAAVAAAVATDLVSGLRVLKGIGAEDAALQRYRVASRQSLTASVRAARAEGMLYGLNQVLVGIFLAVVALVAGRLAAQGQIGVGELVAAVGLTQFLMGPLNRLSWSGAVLAGARACAGRLAEVLSRPPAVLESADTRTPVTTSSASALVIDGVALSDPRGVSWRVDPGEFVAVVAEPRDADILLDALSRVRDPALGRVRLGGRAIDELPLAELRQRIVVVRHELDLFTGTLADNISIDGEPVATDVLSASSADQVVEMVPAGLDARLVEQGRSLSGGQRQRVGLARGLQARSDVLVLEEPTTAVDPATESRIAHGVREFRRDAITVVITASPTLLAVADRVILIRDGVVVSTGTHAELLDSVADYRAAVLS